MPKFESSSLFTPNNTIDLEAGDTIDVPQPPGLVNGDLLDIVISLHHIDGSNSANPNISEQQGFSLYIDTGASLKLVVLRKFIQDASQEPSVYSIEGASNTWGVGAVGVRISGANPENPEALPPEPGSRDGSLMEWPSLDIPTEGSMYLAVGATEREHDVAWDLPLLEAGVAPGSTENTVRASTAYVGYVEEESKGPTGIRTASVGDRSSQLLAYAIAPDPGALPGIRFSTERADGTVPPDGNDYRVAVRESDQHEGTVDKTVAGEISSGVFSFPVPNLEVTGEAIGTTDVNGDLTFTLDHQNVQPELFVATGPTETIVDDGAGNLHLDGDDTAGRGTIDYAAGTGNITGSLDTEAAFSAGYDYRLDEWFLTLTDAAGERGIALWASDSPDISETDSTIRVPTP